MSEKLLTEDLILKKLEEKGIAYPGEIDVPEMQERILHYYDSEIKHDWGHANMYFTVMSTADGYEVYMATEDESKPYFEQDVYYYESDWFEKLPEAIRDGLTIHVDEHYMEEYNYQDAITEVYEDYWNDMKEEVENDLIEEGYDWPKEEDNE